MYLYRTIEEMEKDALQAIESLKGLRALMPLNLPGKFVFSPPDNSRITVSSLAELHEVRSLLREHFGWKDKIANKFYSCGVVIATYRPTEDVKLPIPFELWVEAPPELFPKEILGDCHLKPYTRNEYNVVCSI